MGALEECEPCGGCGTASLELVLTWCPAWDQWLCESCRRRRTDAELGATERANAAARLAAPGK